MSKIYGQLLQFQNKLRKVNKDAKGHNHSYASFDNVVETIAPELTVQGLGYTHTFDGQDIVCTLFNTEGETITSKLTLSTEILKGMNASQSMGATSPNIAVNVYRLAYVIAAPIDLSLIHI